MRTAQDRREVTVGALGHEARVRAPRDSPGPPEGTGGFSCSGDILAPKSHPEPGATWLSVTLQRRPLTACICWVGSAQGSLCPSVLFHSVLSVLCIGPSSSVSSHAVNEHRSQKIKTLTLKGKHREGVTSTEYSVYHGLLEKVLLFLLRYERPRSQVSRQSRSWCSGFCLLRPPRPRAPGAAT